MGKDNIFRFILILGSVVVFPIGMCHRLKAHLASREKLNRRAAVDGFVSFELSDVAPLQRPSYERRPLDPKRASRICKLRHALTSSGAGT